MEILSGSYALIIIVVISFFEIIQCQDPVAPPKVTTFRVIGEVVQRIKNSSNMTQIYFEENYDHNGHRSAFQVTTAEVSNTRILQYEILDQSFVYKENVCKKYNAKQWYEDDTIPNSMKDFGTSAENKLIVFPVRRLLDLEQSEFKIDKFEKSVVYRGVQAQSWSYSFKQEKDVTVDVDAYWSKSDTISTSKFGSVPLGFKLRINNPKMTPTEIYMNLFLFTHDEVNKEMLQPVKGVYCEGRQDSEPFPNTGHLKTLVYKSEMVYEETVSIIDAWFDPINELYSADLIPFRRLNTFGSSVRTVISKKQGFVYTMEHTKTSVTTVTPLSEMDDEPQSIIDLRVPSEWNIASWFGSNSVNYSAIGRTIDYGTPCILYHGIRNDFPKNENGKITSLWEWCLANQLLPEVEFTERRFPLISLNIYITESPYTSSTGVFFKGAKFNFHFYSFKSNEPFILNSTAFDIDDFFEENNKATLIFDLEVNAKDLSDVTELKGDPLCINSLKNAIYNSTGLSPASLRVSNVKVVISDTIKVTFILLGQHPDLPTGVEIITLDQAKSNLLTSINERNIKLEIMKDSKSITVFAKPGTLRLVNFEFTKETIVSEPFRYSVGVMASTGIAMLIFGLGLGTGGFYFQKRAVFKQMELFPTAS